ncbi:MAG: hypothetical protein M0R06_22615, partial [Sphaerochaeta sp.]|nr:hypothetical protein [Sphaerochaeta sp.]
NWGMRYCTHRRSVVLYGAGDSFYPHFPKCKAAVSAVPQRFYLETTITHDHRSWWDLVQNEGLNRLHSFYRLDTLRDVDEFLSIPCYGDKMESSRILVDMRTPLEDMLFPLLTHGLTVSLRSMDKSRSPMTIKTFEGIVDALSDKIGRAVSHHCGGASGWGLTPVIERLGDGILVFRTCFNPQSPRHEIAVKSPTQVEESIISHMLFDVFGHTNIAYNDHWKIYTDWCPRMGCETKGVWYAECSVSRDPGDDRPYQASKCRRDVA